jgi:hypothetical protein
MRDTAFGHLSGGRGTGHPQWLDFGGLGIGAKLMLKVSRYGTFEENDPPRR